MEIGQTISTKFYTDFLMLNKTIDISVSGGGSIFKSVHRPNYLRVKQRFDWHHDFTIVFYTKEQATISALLEKHSTENVGQKITITWSDKGENTANSTFVGVIKNVQVGFDRRGRKRVSLWGFSVTYLLEKGKINQSWLDMKSEEIFESLVQNEMDYSINETSEQAPSYGVAYQESFYNYLLRQANRHGKFCYFDGHIFHWGKSNQAPVIELFYKKNLSAIRVGVGLQAINANGFNADYEQSSLMKIEPNVSSTGQMTSFLMDKSRELWDSSLATYSLELSENDVDDINNISTIKQERKASEMQWLSGLTTEQRLHVGAVVKIYYGQELEGEYFVIYCEQELLIDGQFLCHFTAIPAAVTIAPQNANIIRPHAQAQTAIVTDNDDDLGRVRVQFPYLENESPFLRCVYPENTFFRPEIDSEVLVHFHKNKPELPYVIGVINHQDNPPYADFQSDKNEQKGIITPKNNKILISDKDQEETITIEVSGSKAKLMMTVKEDGKMHIEVANGQLALNAKNIKIEAKDRIEMKAKKLDLKADESIGIDAGEGKFKFQKGLSLKGAGDAVLKFLRIFLN